MVLLSPQRQIPAHCAYYKTKCLARFDFWINDYDEYDTNKYNNDQILAKIFFAYSSWSVNLTLNATTSLYKNGDKKVTNNNDS